MNKLLFITLISIAFLSCNPPKTVTTTTTTTTTSFTETNTLSGKWTLVNYSAYMSMPEGGMPKFVPGDLVWDFGKGGATGRVTISKSSKMKLSPIVDSGIHQFWSRKCLLTVDEQHFLYSFSGDKLIIDSNSDPRISADGAVLTFEQMKN